MHLSAAPEPRREHLRELCDYVLGLYLGYRPYEEQFLLDRARRGFAERNSTSTVLLQQELELQSQLSHQAYQRDQALAELKAHQWRIMQQARVHRVVQVSPEQLLRWEAGLGLLPTSEPRYDEFSEWALTKLLYTADAYLQRMYPLLYCYNHDYANFPKPLIPSFADPFSRTTFTPTGQ